MIEVKFNNQAYLNSYLDDILSNIDPKYKHISTLDTSTKSFPEILALLNGKNESLNITKLKTYQYDALIPKIRLYRVNSSDNSEYEFIFDKDYRTTFINVKDEINQSSTALNTGNNAGIKSFTWNLAGTNPVTAEKNIEVKVELYFDSINAFSGGSYDEMLLLWNSGSPNLLDSKFDNQKNKTTTNFWSLVYHPQLIKQPNKYDSPLFRIKAVVGWEQIPATILNELFSAYSNINEEFTQSDLAMYLNLVAHQFNFKDDGSILLSLNYIGSIENSYSNTNFDLLRGLKEQLNELNNATLRQLRGVTLSDNVVVAGAQAVGGIISDAIDNTADITRSEASKRLAFLSYYQKNKGDLQKLNSALSCAKLGPIKINGTTDQEILGKAVQEQTEKYNDALQKIDDYIQTASIEIKTIFYSRLITNLIENSSDGVPKKTMYAIEVSEEDVKTWLLWKEGTSDNNIKPNFKTQSSDITGGDKTQIDKRSEILALEREAGDTLDFGEGQPDTFDEAMELLTQEEEKIDKKRIYFTTVGHIVDAALNIIEQSLIKAKISLTEFKKQKIIFSNFSPTFEVKDGKAKNFKSLATIPIDLNFLIKFLNDVLYSTGATEYSFYQFIRQLMVKVIEPALESREIPNDEVNKYANTSLASTVVFLGSDSTDKHPLANYYSDTTSNIINLSTTTKSQLSKHYLGNKTNLKVFNYYVIYDKYHKDYGVTGNLVEDRKRGVYHYTIGQDYGLVKAINFKKIDQPFLKESKSVGKKTIYLGQFRDLYNAEIKMIGNNIYHPGMLLFIKPSVEFGNPIGKSGAPTFSQITGVGGYYSVIKVNNEINQESYTTTLDCVFHSNEIAGEGTSSNPDPCAGENLDELKAAGLVNGEEPSLINTGFLSDLDESIRSQKTKKDEEVQADITSEYTPTTF